MEKFNQPVTKLDLTLEYESITGCIAIIVADDGDVCFHRRKSMNGAETVSLVGGKREFIRGKRETLLECLLREVWEETGIIVSPEQVTPIFAIQKHPMSFEQLAFFKIQLANKPDLVIQTPAEFESDPHWCNPKVKADKPLYRYYTNMQALLSAGVIMEFPES